MRCQRGGRGGNKKWKEVVLRFPAPTFFGTYRKAKPVIWQSWFRCFRLEVSAQKSPELTLKTSVPSKYTKRWLVQSGQGRVCPCAHAHGFHRSTDYVLNQQAALSWSAITTQWRLRITKINQQTTTERFGLEEVSGGHVLHHSNLLLMQRTATLELHQVTQDLAQSNFKSLRGRRFHFLFPRPSV